MFEEVDKQEGVSGVCGCLRAVDPWSGRLGQTAFIKVIRFCFVFFNS